MNSLQHVVIYCDIGFFLTAHSDFMLTRRLKDMYHRMLAGPADTPTAIQLLCQVLTNLHDYLIEEELKMVKAEAKCKYNLLSLLKISLISLPPVVSARYTSAGQ